MTQRIGSTTTPGGSATGPMSGAADTASQFGSTLKGTAGHLASDVASQGYAIADEARHVASDVAHQAREQVSSRLERQKSKTVDGLGGVADALRDTGANLKRDPRSATTAEYFETAADRVEQFSDYLQTRTLGDLIQNVEGFARRDPALFVGGAFALGLLGARFLKSSSSTTRTYERGRTYDGYEASYGARPGPRATREPHEAGDPPSSRTPGRDDDRRFGGSYRMGDGVPYDDAYRGAPRRASDSAFSKPSAPPFRGGQSTAGSTMSTKPYDSSTSNSANPQPSAMQPGPTTLPKRPSAPPASVAKAKTPSVPPHANVNTNFAGGVAGTATSSGPDGKSTYGATSGGSLGGQPPTEKVKSPSSPPGATTTSGTPGAPSESKGESKTETKGNG